MYLKLASLFMILCLRLHVLMIIFSPIIMQIGQYITSNGGVVTAEELAPYLDLDDKTVLFDIQSYIQKPVVLVDYFIYEISQTIFPILSWHLLRYNLT